MMLILLVLGKQLVFQQYFTPVKDGVIRGYCHYYTTLSTCARSFSGRSLCEIQGFVQCCHSNWLGRGSQSKLAKPMI